MAICIPQGFGVPVPTGANSYAYSGPPLWWDSTSGPMPFENTNLEDPRWVGSAGFGYPDVDSVPTQLALFRAVYAVDAGVTYLYLSWVLKVDPSVGSSTDNVRVAFYRSGMNGNPVAFLISPTDAPVAATAALPLSVTMYTGSQSGGTWTWTPSSGTGAPPDWAGFQASTASSSRVRVWVDPTPNRRYPWAVQMRVPIAASGNISDGIDLGTAFRMRFQIDATAPDGTIVFYRWPRAASVILGAGFGDPASSDWDDFQLSTGTTCPGGVSLEWGDVGTTNTPSSEILYNRATLPSNTFFVKPRNGTPNDIPASRNPTSSDPGVLNLSARFRIANWGSTPTGGSSVWVDIPGGSDVRNVPTLTSTGVIKAGTQGDMEFNWTVEDPLLKEFENGTLRSHQCMLVELSGPGLTFTKSSLYENMDVEQASTVQRDAEISIAGLAPIAGTHRDVYLYVQTLNMPSTLSPGAPPARPAQAPPFTAELARRAAESRQGNGEGNGNGGGGGPIIVPPPGPPPPPWQEETRPVHLVHVWHTTGQTVTDENGRTRQVLEPQTSFGYYLGHEGALFGWNHKLTGARLVEVAPNFYRISIRHGSSATVTSEVSALEAPADIENILAWLIALLKALLKSLLRALTAPIRRLFRS